MTKKKGQYIVGRVDGEKLPSGYRRKRFHKEQDAKSYVILLTARHPPIPPDGYYVDGPNAPRRVTQRKADREPQPIPKKIVPDGQYIDRRSDSRVDIIHHIYTGDKVNSPHCTCEALHHGTREFNILFTCKHIDEVVFGIGR